MRLRRTTLSAAVLTAVIVFAPTQPAQAAFILGANGNTGMYDLAPPGAASSDGVVNFAVWAGEGGDGWSNDPGLAALGFVGTLVGTDSFLYMYQVVNTDPSGTPPPVGAVVDSTLSTLKVPNGGPPGTNFTGVGIGAVGGLPAVFVDGAGAVGPAANARLGLLPGVVAPGALNSPLDSDPLDGVPSEITAPLGFAGLAGAGIPAGPPFTSTDDGAGFATALFVIPPGGFTTIIFYSSNFSPLYAPGSIKDGADASHGDIPAPVLMGGPLVPEAHNYLSVLALGCVGLVVGLRRWYTRG